MNRFILKVILIATAFLLLMEARLQLSRQNLGWIVWLFVFLLALTAYHVDLLKKLFKPRRKLASKGPVPPVHFNCRSAPIGAIPFQEFEPRDSNASPYPAGEKASK